MSSSKNRALEVRDDTEVNQGIIDKTTTNDEIAMRANNNDEVRV